MLSRTLLPTDPPISPLAEVVTAFEESDPDAVALLLPFDDRLTPERIEARARRKFPTRAPGERAETIAQAVAIQELIIAEAAARARSYPPVTTARAVPIEKRERCWTALAEALERNPSMTASEGMALLNAEGSVTVAPSSFHNVYWRHALERVPPQVRQLREEMTAHRPGDGKLPRSAGGRDHIRQLVAVIKRDYPDWHRGQIMDEVRRVTSFQFQDPIAFERSYVVMVEPAPPDAVVQTRPQPLANPGRAPMRIANSAEAHPASAEINVPQATVDGPLSLLRTLLAATDPLLPAELRPAEDGRVHVYLNTQPIAVAESYRLMSLVYAEMAKLAIEATS